MLLPRVEPFVRGPVERKRVEPVLWMHRPAERDAEAGACENTLQAARESRRLLGAPRAPPRRRCEVTAGIRTGALPLQTTAASLLRGIQVSASCAARNRLRKYVKTTKNTIACSTAIVTPAICWSVSTERPHSE